MLSQLGKRWRAFTSLVDESTFEEMTRAAEKEVPKRNMHFWRPWQLKDECIAERSIKGNVINILPYDSESNWKLPFFNFFGLVQGKIRCGGHCALDFLAEIVGLLVYGGRRGQRHLVTLLTNWSFESPPKGWSSPLFRQESLEERLELVLVFVA